MGFGLQKLMIVQRRVQSKIRFVHSDYALHSPQNRFMVTNGEIRDNGEDGNQHFLLFPQYFQHFLKTNFQMLSSAKDFNLDWSNLFGFVDFSS